MTTSSNNAANCMYARVKSSVFIDSLRLEVLTPIRASLKGILKDDKGSVCSSFETDMDEQQHEYTWRNLNDLPYGVYTLQLFTGSDETLFRLVKRV